MLNGLPQTNLTVTPWQTAQLAVMARGYPLPKFRWSQSADGSTFHDLPNETNSTLNISLVLAGHAGVYRVRMTNPLGTNYAYAWLTVKPPPRLRITEAMSQACSLDSPDWWELTNTGDEPVNLYGYRWDDWPGNIGGGPTITNTIILQPGESVILLEGGTPEDFIRWWGADNLPPNLQFIRYTANGLDQLQDSIRLWNPTATDDADFIDDVSFSWACPGASFWFDAEACPVSIFGVCHAEGECGAFRAANGGDIGSPGWTKWTRQWTRPQLTSVRPEPKVLMVGASRVVWLQWKAQPGSTCRVQYTPRLTIPTSAIQWSDLGTFHFNTAAGSAIDTSLVETDPCRFYRLLLVSPAPCGCPGE
jgi:hypothetical protein